MITDQFRVGNHVFSSRLLVGTGKFGSSNNDVVTLQGFRAIADIDKAGGMMMGTSDM